MLATYVIQALSSDGRGIARGNPGEKVTFVSQALPGEIVLARFLSERRTFCEAEAVEIVSASPMPCLPPARIRRCAEAVRSCAWTIQSSFAGKSALCGMP